jgi:outer membrane PBP1 activator LpoA protein
MRTHVSVICGFLVACLLPASSHAQSGPPSASATREAVLKEVRLLRQTLEKQAATTARTQLVVARLALYDQRAARARSLVERLEAEMENVERERGQLQAASREMARSLEQVTDPERRQQLESESRMTRTRMVEVETQRARAQARLDDAKQSLDLESGRYEELERWLNEMDRQLQVGP